jgi:carboxylesterase type B
LWEQIVNTSQWTIKNIANFGGDPNQITIAGDSAGAGSVRVLLGSPPAKGKFQGAFALSNLGGGVDLDLTSNYATSYSSYITVEESYALVGQNLFKAAGCTQSSLQAQIACLEAVPALTLTGYGDIAAKVVQDGYYVNTEELDVANKNRGTSHVPAMFGVCHDEGAAIGATYPKTPVTSEVAGIEAALGISPQYAQAIIDSGLFPYYDTGNITLDSFNVSQRVATDNNFRCVDQATMYAGAISGAFKGSYFFQLTRTIGGYDPNGLGGAPVTPGYPYGNPNLPYFRYHSSDVPWVTGNLDTIRDDADLWSVQLQVGYFGEFFKSGQPNPKESYLKVRGYTKPIDAIRKTGPWESIRNKEGPIRLLDWPSVASDFVEQEQCKWLNYSISYYVDGGL